jgi:hypothetical protein
MAEGKYLTDDKYYYNAPVTSIFAYGLNAFTGTLWQIDAFYVTPIWCNAFTEWHNEKYGTNLVPVYQDSYGNPIRYINNSERFLETANPYATGFRIPSHEEWELAARWNGNSNINSVTKTINRIDFSRQPIKFTKGNSASGAKGPVNNFTENDNVAIWQNNAGNVSYPIGVKLKQPNALGLYDMSGNAWERTTYYSLNSNVVYTLFKGGSIASKYNDLAVGNIASSATNIGFRVARSAE